MSKNKINAQLNQLRKRGFDSIKLWNLGLLKYKPKELAKKEIIEFIKTNKRRPNKRSKIISEKKMGITTVNLSRYDKKFKMTINKLCPPLTPQLMAKIAIEKAIKKCPKNVKILTPVNKIKTCFQKIKLRSIDHGIFVQSLQVLTIKPWKMGLSGHPKESHFYRTRNQRKKILCINTNTTYISMSQASKNLNISTGDISACCSKKRNHARGYRFKYV